MSELAVDEDFTVVRANQAIEDIHESGFTRAVLSDQRVNFALAYVKIDIVVGNDAWPGFRDASHLHREGRCTLFGLGYGCTFLHRLSSCDVVGPRLAIFIPACNAALAASPADSAGCKERIVGHSSFNRTPVHRECHRRQVALCAPQDLPMQLT